MNVFVPTLRWVLRLTQTSTDLRQRRRAFGQRRRLAVGGPRRTPALHRAHMHPQRLRDQSVVLLAGGEPLGRLQPDLLPERPALSRQPTTLRIPHEEGVPPGTTDVSPLRHHSFKVSRPGTAGGGPGCLPVPPRGGSARPLSRRRVRRRPTPARCRSGRRTTALPLRWRSTTPAWDS